MKKLLFVLAILGVAALFSSCEESNYIDSHKVENNELKVISEGEIYYLPLNYFKIDEAERTGNCTILLEDEVKTANTGYTPAECVEVLSTMQYGNYTVRRCLYKTSFEVMVTSWTHEPRYHYLPFMFEAEEVWLNGQKVVEQPWVFEKIHTNLTELSLSDEEKEDIFGKYLLDFQMVAHNRYYKYQTPSFNSPFYVTRLNKSNLYVSPDDIDVVVTYDWHPE